MRIAYTTVYDPNDRLQWSGLGYSIMNALRESGTIVTPVGPLQTRLPLLGRALAGVHRRAFKSSYEYQREAHVCRYYGHQIQRRLAEGDFDAVLSPGVTPVSRLRCAQPIVIYADATFRCYAKHYGLYQGYASSTLRAAEATERAAFERARLAIFASEWAATSARTDYGIASEKIRIIPFGANLDNPPNEASVNASIADRPANTCRLVSIGVDWSRKGMAKAVALAGALNERGIRTTLTIVGCKPPKKVELPSYVRLAGFIDKRTPEGEWKIVQLLLGSHFHVLFSTAEAFGVVFAEANACGVPNIALDVGGIPTAVVNGAGGQRFNRERPVGEIADYIENSIDPCTYAGIARRARREYELRLNWSAAGMALRREMASAIELAAQAE